MTIIKKNLPAILFGKYHCLAAYQLTVNYQGIFEHARIKLTTANDNIPLSFLQ